MSPMERRLEEMHADIRAIDKLLRGNGHPGLVTRVSILEDRAKRAAVVAGGTASVIAAIIGLAAKMI